MKKVSPLLLAASAGLFLAFGAPIIALSLTNLIETPLTIENASSQNALNIIQEQTVGKSRATSGAVFLDNTKNMNTGLTLYSNADSAVAQPLARFEIDNTSWDEEVLYIRSDSPTSRGLIRLDSPAPEIEFVETDQGGGGAGKFEVRVQHDEFQINSRRSDDTTFENKFTMAHDGDVTVKGGLNVVGGCVAVDGKCIGGTTSSSASASLPIVNGAPASAECNADSERGAMKLDVQNGRLYTCVGGTRGWDYVQLSN